MREMTPERLRELRRVAVERERCPKCGETERHYWCRCGTLIKGTACPMCDRTREEAMKRERADDSIPLACGTEVTPDGRVIREGEVCLRRQLAQAQAEVERLRWERGTTRYMLHSSEYSAWACEADDCDALWYLEDGTPSENRMRYCPGCGRRIVAEVRDVGELLGIEVKGDGEEGGASDA